MGYVLKMFPRLSETFILNEILELEQQGLALRIFSLKRPVDAVCHSQASAVRSPVTYLPEKLWQQPLRGMSAQFHVWRKYRTAWCHTLRNVLRRLRSDGNYATLLGFSQACCIVKEMRGIRHLHAHYANVPSKIALLVHRLTGVPYSVTTHAKDIFQNEPFASPKLHERLGRARFVVANSQYSARHMSARLEKGARIETIYNGLDLDLFAFRNGAPVEPLILSVGRLVEKKGFSTLIGACRVLKERGTKFTCELVGTGPLSGALKEQIRNSGLGERVKMVGPLPQQSLRQNYARAMVFALPCVQAADGDRDLLPNVLKEAMAVGVPVVTTRLEGIDELLEDGVNGLLVPPGDELALAEKLELLMGDSQLRHRLASRARKVIEERFDRRASFSRLKTLLLEPSHPESMELPRPAQIETGVL